MCDIATEIVSSACLSHRLQEISVKDRADFKSISNEGFVWSKRRHLDLGNVRYSVLYNFLYRMCSKAWVSSSDQQAFFALGAFNRCIARYSSLDIHAANTKLSHNMKGDVIEFCLEPCRYVAPTDAENQNRLRMNALIKKFHEQLVFLEKLLFAHNGVGPPSVAQYPDVYMFAKACVLVVCIDAANGADGPQCPDVRSLQALDPLVRDFNLYISLMSA
jgi:hypothetical protein